MYSDLPESYEWFQRFILESRFMGAAAKATSLSATLPMFLAIGQPTF